jgi:hypothetical protein
MNEKNHQVDVIIDHATTIFNDIEIIKTDDAITLLENGIVFGKVKGHYSTDGHFIGWGVNCLVKSEICKMIYLNEWEYNKMVNKVFSTTPGALTELFNLYSRGFKQLQRATS